MKHLFIPIFLLFSINLSSQTADQIKADYQNFYWGEGTGTTLKRADDEALSMLINQISAQVESSFELLKQESDKDFSEKAKSIVKTYSSATLKNTERMVLAEEPTAKVFRFIKRAELYSIFNSRKEKILEFKKNGDLALNERSIADALKYYYWCLTLLRSHPEGNTMKCESGELLTAWLPAQMEKVFNGVNISLGELKKEEGYSTQVLSIVYKGNPVSNYDYAYWDGNNWSNIISARDGLGFIEFPGEQPLLKEVKIKSEYLFENEAAIDKELLDVMQKLDPIPFHDSYKIARPMEVKVITDSLKPNQNIVATNQNNETNNQNNIVTNQNNAATNQNNTTTSQNNAATSQNNTATVDNTTVANDNSAVNKIPDQIFSNVTDQTPYLKAVNTLKEAIRKGNYASAMPLFTTNGYEIFTKLVQYGKARILSDKELVFVQQGKDVFCRAIPMSFNFQNNNKQFVEELVLSFDSTRKISNLSFGLGDKAISDISNKSTWPEKVRMQMINFMENYKTAYALKRLDYIERVFSDDALIIIGTVLKVQSGEMNQYQNHQIVKYNRVTKEEYIKRLKFAFGSTEYINIKFEDNEIRKSGKGGEIYGIQIKQNFYSTNYSDAGYLFLMLDFEKPDEPSIHIRTWQPEKNADGSIYGLNDFN